MNTEELVISQLLSNDSFVRKVIPYFRKDYFSDQHNKVLFETVEQFFKEFNAVPSKEAVTILIENRNDLNSDVVEKAVETLALRVTDEVQNMDWLMTTAEKFCKDRAIYNAFKQGLAILDDPKKSVGILPQLMADALAVGFDSNLGHDYLDDAEERFEYYHNVETRIPFHIDILNIATKGGVIRKSLNVLLGGTNVGKTMLMADLAAHYLTMGLNVIYFTMEMPEKEISKRVDANLLDCGLADLEALPKETFMRRIEAIKRRTKGVLKVKEYPSSSASVLDFERHINELKTKYNFIPDVILVDYLTITASSRYKPGTVNSFNYYKAVAEEIRALNQKLNTVGWSAMQLNRGGFSNSDAGLTDISESFGVAMTVDWAAVIISTEDLDLRGQLLFKQEKSRYSNKDDYRKFVVGIDKNKQKMHDVADPTADLSGMEDDDEDKPLMDNTGFGARDAEDRKLKRRGKFNRPNGMNGLKF